MFQRSNSKPPRTHIDAKPLVEGFVDPVILIDANTIIIAYNEAVLDLFEDVEAGKPLSYTTRNSELLENIASTTKSGKRAVLTFGLKRPRKRTVSATLIPLAQKTKTRGRPYIFIHMRDMSERERLASMRMHFIANASHELRTPLSSLLGFIETLQTSAKDDPVARERFLEIMATQARRMSRLISDLLSLSRLEMNSLPPPGEAVNIVDTVTVVVELLKPLASENNVELITSVPSDSKTNPLLVRGQRDELEQVIQNIVHNAIRYGYSGDGGKVWIQIDRLTPTKRHGPRLSIAVKDNGHGIAKMHIPHLTERFYRVDKVISRNKGGTGLGLAIAKHIIERHRGKLAVKSKQGKGSTFTIFLPVINLDN